MNIQLHRKQAIMLVLAMLLAIASYWIPLPQQPTFPEEQPKLSDPVEKPKFTEPPTFPRESAAMWRFPIIAPNSQTARLDPLVQPGSSGEALSWPAKRSIDSRERDNSETLHAR